MHTHTLRPGHVLYHGSRRLYQLQRNVQALEGELAQYLETSSFAYDLPSLDEETTAAITDFVAKARTPLYDTVAMTKELLYLATAVTLQRTGYGALSTYAVLNAFLTDEDMADVYDVLNFAYDVEDRAPADARALFDVAFYSSMRLPVQFFTTSYEYASGYAAPCGATYSYTLEKEVTLPLLDDQVTICILGQQVFHSRESYREHDIAYHTSAADAAALRVFILDSAGVFVSNWALIVLLTACCTPREGFGTVALQDLLAGADWFTYFEHDLLSPHTLWRFVTLDYGQLPRAPTVRRITLYDTDALLLKTLLEDGRYKGYASQHPNEVALFNPEQYGRMDLTEVAREDDSFVSIV